MEFTNNAGTSSPAADSDDISLFLRQLLRRSSPSPSLPPSVTPSSSLPSPKQFGSVLDNPPLVPYRSAVFCAAESSGVVLNSSRCFPAAGGCNLSSASESLTGSVQMRSFENEADEYDCDSEEGPEAVVDGVQLKQALPRNSSKRSRAAEVHNLSEKRRRSRINEKMKALQNLIPNSNKTDKASMLDEAIEYLKQLQLQVQMLSMRNGLSLHPLCLPGVPGIMNPVQLSQVEPSFDTREGAQHTSMSNTLSANPEAPHNVFNLPDPSVPLTRPSVQNASGIINSGASFGLGSSFQAQFGPFQSHGTSEDICREDDLHPSQLVVNSSEMSSLGTGNTTPSPLTFKTQESHVKDSKEESLFVSSNYNRLYARNSAQSDQLTARR